MSMHMRHNTSQHSLRINESFIRPTSNSKSTSMPGSSTSSEKSVKSGKFASSSSSSKASSSKSNNTSRKSFKKPASSSGKTSASSRKSASSKSSSIINGTSSTKSSLLGSSMKTMSLRSSKSSNSSGSSSTGLTGSSNASNLISQRFNQHETGSYFSQIEEAILKSTHPIKLNHTDEVSALGNHGIWANKDEVVNWKGDIPICEYSLNEDTRPRIITKRALKNLEYIQELAIRYLRPPTPPTPGDIVITQEANSIIPPAPPLVIRQQPPRPSTPEPLVLREAPPKPPSAIGRKVITISGKKLPPPPRKVVIERLPPLPCKPQAIIAERWLPYTAVKRRVIFQGAPPDPIIVKPRNIVVQWEPPSVQVRKEIRYLGVVRADPSDYVQRFGVTLKNSDDLPQVVKDIPTPDGLVLAADFHNNDVYELEGEVEALKLVDLDREGLAEYRSQLKKFENGYETSITSIIDQIFAQLDKDGNGFFSIREAERVLLRLNSRLGRSYGEKELKLLFKDLDPNNDGNIGLKEFRAAFERVL